LDNFVYQRFLKGEDITFTFDEDVGVIKARKAFFYYGPYKYVTPWVWIRGSAVHAPGRQLQTPRPIIFQIMIFRSFPTETLFTTFYFPLHDHWNPLPTIWCRRGSPKPSRDLTERSQSSSTTVGDGTKGRDRNQPIYTSLVLGFLVEESSNCNALIPQPTSFHKITLPGLPPRNWNALLCSV